MDTKREKRENRDRKEKVLFLYKTVGDLLEDRVDLNKLKVEDITQRAGIGKGTAYDYFDSKEDIIVSAIEYLNKKLLAGMEERLLQCNGFREKLECCFTMLESGHANSGCIFKILHIFFGSGTISEELRRRMENHKEEGPLRLLRHLVQTGKGEGILDDGLSGDYMVLVLSGRLLIYLAYLNNTDMIPEMKKEEMKELLYRGILAEIGKAEC